MMNPSDIAIIIPALNEEDSIGRVLLDLPLELRRQIIIGNNGSTDGTAEIARQFGATVVDEPERGYGAACLKAVHKAIELHEPKILVFLDADYSDYPQDIMRLLNKMQAENLELVIGSRNLGEAEAGALLPQAKFGNWLATSLLHLRYRYRFTDLGPFRAVTRIAYESMDMKDRNFGWTMEMQVKALRLGLRVGETSVRYRRRVGNSKITGTISGSIRAGYKILLTLFRYSGPGTRFFSFVSTPRTNTPAAS